MTTVDELKVLLGSLLSNLPTILACIVALVVVSTRGPRLTGVALWALLGFGLTMVLSIVAPLSWIMLQGYLTDHALSIVDHGWMFSVLGVFNSILDAAALIFLLIAVCAGRSPGLIPPPLPPV